uniref:Uncharacterized protein n=1 Tax=Romanomermis culicivorax TaxID=13658 RepID=A0A915L2T1_ROMCU
MDQPFCHDVEKYTTKKKEFVCMKRLLIAYDDRIFTVKIHCTAEYGFGRDEKKSKQDRVRDTRGNEETQNG